MRRPLSVALLAALAAATPVLAEARASRPAPSVARAAVGAGRVVVDTLWSQALGTRKQFVVYLPPSYDREPARRFPVAYYLHGLMGSEWDWVRQGAIAAALDSSVARGGAELIVVMPDGDDGWYTTWNTLGSYAQCLRAPPAREPAASYCVPWPHYDDYIARDLVAKVDSSYRTVAARAHRAIAGLSMGGYGALTLALRYPEVYAAAASHSGVLSPLYLGPHPFAGAPRYATTLAELREGWGRRWPLIAPAFGADTAAWWSRAPARLVTRLAAEQREHVPALFLDVGRDDPLADQTRDFHATLERLGIPNRYAEWPGAHDWAYWRAHVGESLHWIAGIIGQRDTTGAAPSPRPGGAPSPEPR